MRVLTVALAQNESRLIRHFVSHYRRLGDVRIYDDHSTDDTAAAAVSAGATVVPIEDGGAPDLETRLCWVKNHSWKSVRDQYDWIIAVDADEFLYHDNLPEVLRHGHELSVPILVPCGYEIASYESPRDDIPVTTQMRRGAVNPCYSKPCCFNPNLIDEINIWGGSHHATPSGSRTFYYFFPYPGLKLLHYRYLGVAWVVARLSNQKRSWSVDASKLERDIIALDQRSSEVIPEGPFHWHECAPIAAPPFVEADRIWRPQTDAPIPEVSKPPAARISTRPVGRWFLREPVLPRTPSG